MCSVFVTILYVLFAFFSRMGKELLTLALQPPTKDVPRRSNNSPMKNPFWHVLLACLFQIQGEGGAVMAAGRGAASVVAGAAATTAPHYRGIIGTLGTISREEGVRALYNGLVPGLQRQMAFASIRIGLYDSVKSFYMDVFRSM